MQPFMPSGGTMQPFNPKPGENSQSNSANTQMVANLIQTIKPDSQDSGFAQFNPPKPQYVEHRAPTRKASSIIKKGGAPPTDL
jgi:hypothetical protein